jgi:hypothetical protein
MPTHITEVRLPGTHRGGRLALGGKCLLVVLHCAKRGQRQRVIAGRVLSCERRGGLFGCEIALGLRDRRLLQRIFRMQVGERCRLILNDRFGMREIALIATTPRSAAAISCKLPPKVPIAVRTGATRTTERGDVMACLSLVEVLSNRRAQKRADAPI